MKKILWAVTLAVCSSAWVEAQTIADLARQERARRQKVQAKIVVTTETLKTQEPAAAGEAVALPAPAAVGAGAVVAPPAAGSPPQPASTRDEKWWRGEFQKANDDLRRAQTQIRVLELDLNRANLDLLQRSDIYNREGRVGAEIATINARLDSARKAMETARQKISQLEDDLRRAGGPPGWAR